MPFKARCPAAVGSNTHGNKLACTSSQDTKPKICGRRCWASIRSFLLTRLSAIPRETNSPTSQALPPGALQQCSAQACTHNKMQATLLGHRVISNPCFRATGNEIFHSSLKPVSSGIQPLSSPQWEGHVPLSKSVTTRQPPQRAATSPHCHLSSPTPNISVQALQTPGYS